MQSKRQSLIESLFGTGVGFIIALLTQVLVFPFYGLEVSLSTNLQLTFIFTFVSVVRSYAIRRFFNYLHTKEKNNAATQASAIRKSH